MVSGFKCSIRLFIRYDIHRFNEVEYCIYTESIAFKVISGDAFTMPSGPGFINTILVHVLQAFYCSTYFWNDCSA